MSTPAIDLSIIVPAYNEENRITPTLLELDEHLSLGNMRYEIVVVDDGSSDRTVPVVSKIAAEHQQIRLIGTRPNRGKGHAVRVGMLEARGAVRIMFDADGSMPATELPKLYNPVATGEVDVAIGSRYAAIGAQADQPRWRVAWSRMCNWFIQRTVVAGVADTQCGFKAFSASAATVLFSRATIDGWAFDLEILALADRFGMTIEECPVTWVDDEQSKVNPIRDFVSVVREWMTIRRNLRRGVYGQLAEVSS